MKRREFIIAASRNTRFQAVRLALPTWVGLAPTDRACFAWRLPSLDHLIGRCKQRRRHGEPECCCRFEVDHKLKSGWQQKRFAPLSTFAV
jgi:hypothetical protein